MNGVFDSLVILEMEDGDRLQILLRMPLHNRSHQVTGRKGGRVRTLCVRALGDSTYRTAYAPYAAARIDDRTQRSTVELEPKLEPKLKA